MWLRIGKVFWIEDKFGLIVFFTGVLGWLSTILKILVLVYV